MTTAKTLPRLGLVLAATVTASLLVTPGQAAGARADQPDMIMSLDAQHRLLPTGSTPAAVGPADEASVRGRTAQVGMLATRPRVGLSPCDDDPSWLCGSIRVPVDRARPLGRKLSVAFAVLPHSNRHSTAKDAVFASDGGPGISNVANRGFLQFLTDGLTENRDLFVVDYRGTGSSGAIDCPLLQRAIGDFRSDPARIVKAIGRCGRRLGEDADRYGSGDIAKDIEAVRAALGYRRIRMYGLSYAGTFLSAYATRYPHRVRALVIDAGAPATDPRHSWTWGMDIPPSMARTVDLFCRRAPACAAAQPRASTALARLASAVRRHPVRGRVQVSGLGTRWVTVDEFTLVTIAGDTLNQAELAAVAQAFQEGDEVPLLRLGGEASRPFEPAPPELDSAGDNAAVFCNDQDFVWKRSDPVPVRRAKYRRALADLGPSGFAPFSPRAWTEHFLSDYCLRWPAPDRFVPAIPRGRTVTGVPVMILSGDFDTAVPTRTTRELLRVFPEATFVRIPGAGHPAVAWSDCARLGMHEFLRTFRTAQTRSCRTPGWVVEATSAFPRTAAGAAPAAPRRGDRSTALDRRVATATVQTVRDAMLRSFRVPGAVGAVTGLRGGRAYFDFTGFPTVRIRMHELRFAGDVVVSGRFVTDFSDNRARFTATVDGPGAHDGRLTATGGFPGPAYRDFLVTGTLAGRRIAVSVPAN